MRYLLISLCLIVVGCGSYPKKMGFEPNEFSTDILNPYFSDTAKDYVYKAQITVKENYFGGIFIVKKVGTNEHRVVFTTEMGNKIFDFNYSDNDFEVNYIVDRLNKKLLINMLRNDFRVLIEDEPLKINSYLFENKKMVAAKIDAKSYFYYFNNRDLTKIVKVKNTKEKISYTFMDVNNDLANNILIEHNRFNLKINLSKI